MEFMARDLMSPWKPGWELIRQTFKRHVAHSLLFGYIQTKDDLGDLLQAAQIALVPTVVMVFRPVVNRKLARQEHFSEIFRHDLFNKLEQLFSNEQEALIAMMGQNNILTVMVGSTDSVLLLPAQLNNDTGIAEAAKRYAYYIKAYLERDAVYTIAVGIGCCYHDFQLLPKSYREAVKAVESSFYSACGTVLHITEVPQVKRSDYYVSFVRYEEALTDSLRKGEWDSFHRIVQIMMADIIRAADIPPEVLKVRMLELLTLVSRTVIDMGAEASKLLDLKVRLGQEIQEIMTANELQEWMEEALRDISWFAQEHEADMISKAITKVKRYLHGNYGRNISLDELAQHVMLSPHYLSHAFSKFSGVSITEYLRKVRVHKAQVLLRNSDKTVTEIAAIVGYGDPNYFARVFKGITGRSPHQYRKGG